jgi:hypothetical protein
MMEASDLLAHLKGQQLKRIMAFIFCLQSLDDTNQRSQNLAENKSHVLHEVQHDLKISFLNGISQRHFMNRNNLSIIMHRK